MPGLRKPVKANSTCADYSRHSRISKYTENHLVNRVCQSGTLSVYIFPDNHVKYPEALKSVLLCSHHISVFYLLFEKLSDSIWGKKNCIVTGAWQSVRYKFISTTLLIREVYRQIEGIIAILDSILLSVNSSDSCYSVLWLLPYGEQTPCEGQDSAVRSHLKEKGHSFEESI